MLKAPEPAPPAAAQPTETKKTETETTKHPKKKGSKGPSAKAVPEKKEEDWEEFARKLAKNDPQPTATVSSTSVTETRQIKVDFHKIMRAPTHAKLSRWLKQNESHLDNFTITDQKENTWSWIHGIMLLGPDLDVIATLMKSLFEDPTTGPIARRFMNTTNNQARISPIYYAALHHQYEVVLDLAELGADLTLLTATNSHLLHTLGELDSAFADRMPTAHHDAKICLDMILSKLSPQQREDLKTLKTNKGDSIFDTAIIWDILVFFEPYAKLGIPIRGELQDTFLETATKFGLTQVLSLVRKDPYNLESAC